MLFRPVLVLLLAGSCLAQNANRMDEVVASYVAEHKFMGAVLVARGADVVFSKGYGSANLEWEVPNTPNTLYRVASITKQFTAASILLLEERGKLSVSDPVKKYLPDAPAAWGKVTIFHLLTHTSGIPDDTESKDMEQVARLLTTPAALLERFRDKPLASEPGERQYYNNSGYALLGCLIEKASGQDFATFVRENLLTPLNMKDSGIDTGAALVRHLAAGYDPAQQGFENAAHPTYTNLYQGAGALYSTTRDLLLWENGLFGGKVLASESLEKMTTPFRNNYAFGLVVRTFRGHKVIGHSGASDGVSAELDYYPGDKLTVVILANLRFAPVGEIARHLARLAHGETVKLQSERREIPIEPAVLSRYAGAYQLNSGGKLLITVEGNHLVSTPGGQAPVSFFPEAEHSFFRRGVDEQIEFPPETAAPAAQLVLHREEGDTTAKRLEEAEFRRLSEQADMAAKRFKEQKPYPGGDAVVRKLIDGLRAGKPDDAILAPSLYVGIRGQVSQLQALFAERGAIQSVEFQRVAPSGFDIYLIKADIGPLESQIWLAPDGKVSGVFFRRLR